jgi:hypothetical protein
MRKNSNPVFYLSILIWACAKRDKYCIMYTCIHMGRWCMELYKHMYTIALLMNIIIYIYTQIASNSQLSQGQLKNHKATGTSAAHQFLQLALGFGAFSFNSIFTWSSFRCSSTWWVEDLCHDHGNDIIDIIMIHDHYLLVVSTILKNISQWEGLSHILWKIKNVWNHQPDYDDFDPSDHYDPSDHLWLKNVVNVVVILIVIMMPVALLLRQSLEPCKVLRSSSEEHAPYLSPAEISWPETSGNAPGKSSSKAIFWPSSWFSKAKVQNSNRWIGLRENLQETMFFPFFYGVFL